jgi:hypothetical protein
MSDSLLAGACSSFHHRVCIHHHINVTGNKYTLAAPSDAAAMAWATHTYRGFGAHRHVLLVSDPAALGRKFRYLSTCRR